ncbi:hypothetical protein SAMN04487948_10111 [Halogranum amylolyticum]|uniref:Uncharacterized protein n=1 Tax=Halogranum amylolyticum TaxID=660520 RepID=A0A1H8MQ81_9EURY|nr:hypothetical protein SAMN04487948_10111 [Halogranum amylolyticum]
MNVFIHVFSVTVDDVLAVELVVLHQWIVYPKSVGVVGYRLLLVICEAESHPRFVDGFRWDNVSLSRSTANDGEDGWVVSLMRAPARATPETNSRRVAMAQNILNQTLAYFLLF